MLLFSALCLYKGNKDYTLYLRLFIICVIAPLHQHENNYYVCGLYVEHNKTLHIQVTRNYNT